MARPQITLLTSSIVSLCPLSVPETNLISGIDGSVLLSLKNDDNGNAFGYVVSGSSDFDSDGKLDLVVGMPYEDVGDEHICFRS